jgi:hypothetical protein
MGLLCTTGRRSWSSGAIFDIGIGGFSAGRGLSRNRIGWPAGAPRPSQIIAVWTAKMCSAGCPVLSVSQLRLPISRIVVWIYPCIRYRKSKI